METDFNFITKKRGRKGEGRATVFKAIQLPVDIIDELKLYRDVYGALQSKTKDSNGNPIPEKVSFEQILRRWMDNVDYFDPEAHAMVNNILSERRRVAFPPTYDVDPFTYPIGEFRYMFETALPHEEREIVVFGVVELVHRSDGVADYCSKHIPVD